MKEKIMKQEKGITLIALVITIIVLLILAGVAISMLSGENGILNQAADAKTKTEKESTEEQVKLAAMSALTVGNGEIKGTDAYKELNDGLKEAGYTGEEIISLPKTVTINGIEYVISGNGTVIGDPSGVEKNVGKEITGEKAVLLDANNEQIVVPVGFKIKEDSRTEVKGGIVVVAPDGSEFVWVPVTDITKMATETSGTDTKGRTNYQGKLYDFSSTGATEKTSYGQGTTSYREPSLLNSILASRDDEELEKAMQEDYNEMIESVKENKGFYVGRYETSLNTTTGYAQSKSGETSVTSYYIGDWYGFYEKQKEYSEKNTTITNSVVSSMIWGSQYDQMMIWMQSNAIGTTGIVETDKLNNIYNDLLVGNGWEWTLEAAYNDYRVSRCISEYYREIHMVGDYTSADVVSRFALYVK